MAASVDIVFFQIAGKCYLYVVILYNRYKLHYLAIFMYSRAWIIFFMDLVYMYYATSPSPTPNPWFLSINQYPHFLLIFNFKSPTISFPTIVNYLTRRPFSRSLHRPSRYSLHYICVYLFYLFISILFIIFCLFHLFYTWGFMTDGTLHYPNHWNCALFMND